MPTFFEGRGASKIFLPPTKLTKPKEFYVLFLIAELYGLWAFWYCVWKLKEDIQQKSGMNLDEIANIERFDSVKISRSETNQSSISAPKDDSVVEKDSDDIFSRKVSIRNESLNAKDGFVCNLNYFSDDIRNLVFVLTGDIPQ